MIQCRIWSLTSNCHLCLLHFVATSWCCCCCFFVWSRCRVVSTDLHQGCWHCSCFPWNFSSKIRRQFEYYLWKVHLSKIEPVANCLKWLLSTWKCCFLQQFMLCRFVQIVPQPDWWTFCLLCASFWWWLLGYLRWSPQCLWCPNRHLLKTIPEYVRCVHLALVAFR